MIIGFANEKGGVSKTTLAVHTATYLARQGNRVVLVDLDTQGHVSLFLNVEPKDDVAQLLRATLYLDQSRRPPIHSFLHPYPDPAYGNLVIVRGYSETREIEVDLFRPNIPSPGKVLKDALSPLIDYGAIVVIDTGPYAGKIQEAVLEASDHLFVPAKPEGASEAGIIKITQHLGQLDRTVTGLIPTQIKGTSAKHHNTIKVWRERQTLGGLVYFDPPYGLVGMPDRVIWSQLYRTATTIWDTKAIELGVSKRDLEKARAEMLAIQRRIEYDIGLRRQR